MPVYHRLLWTPELKGEEYQGPIDGVKPIDYPEAYEYLMELRCVLALDERLYQNGNSHCKVCITCYNNTPDEYKNEYVIVAPHNLVHKNSADHQTHCTHCNTWIVQVRPAHECKACIEEYLNASKDYLDEGWGLQVIQRWREE